MIRVPTPREYADLPYIERIRIYDAMKDLIAGYAAIELDRRAS
jgi:hypothetical protein